MLTENLLLTIIGGAVGALAATWLLRLVAVLIPSNTMMQIPGGAAAFYLDAHTFLVLLVIAIGSGVLFGLTSSLRVLRTDACVRMRETVRTVSAGKRAQVWRRSLVCTQIALSAMLLIGAALLMQSFWRLQRVDRGYQVDNALSFSLLLPPARYPEAHQREMFFAQVIERLRALPGVATVGATTLLSARGRPFVIEGQQPASRDAAPTAVYRLATTEYFDAIGIPLRRGRHFSTTDAADTPPVAIVNQTLARMLSADGDPLGRKLQVLGPPADVWVTVIGVAGDVKEALDPRYPLQLDARPTIYRPVSQEQTSGMTTIVRTKMDPLGLATAVRREVAAVDSAIPILSLQSVRQGVVESAATPRFNTLVLGGFAMIALVLAAVGLYAVIAYAVHQRAREIGIRMALGAAPGRLLRGVIGEGVGLAVIGTVLGVIGARAAVRVIAHQLYGVAMTDLVAFTVVPSLLIVVAAAASYVPARRAAAVDPLVALRQE